MICSDNGDNVVIVVVGDGDVGNSRDDASTSDDVSVNVAEVKLAGVTSFCKLLGICEEETVLNLSSEAVTEFEVAFT